MFFNHINAQIIIKFSDKVVRGDLYLVCNFNPLTKAGDLDCTVWPVELSRKMAWQNFTTVRNSSNCIVLIAIQVARHVRTIFPSVRSFVRTTHRNFIGTIDPSSALIVKISQPVSCNIPGTWYEVLLRGYWSRVLLSRSWLK